MKFHLNPASIHINDKSTTKNILNIKKNKS